MEKAARWRVFFWNEIIAMRVHVARVACAVVVLHRRGVGATSAGVESLVEPAAVGRTHQDG